MEQNPAKHTSKLRTNSQNHVEKHHNRLISEKSPYLLQHAENPVGWYPWGEEAFERAHADKKPIFLSIGYSTCHWCHVMAHESFEDPEIAKLMNETFVSIKVDREERPDIDNIYMSICQMMTGGGGWPLTIIMTPDKKPFFAGTYIPKHSRFGRIGMMELIPRIKELWTTRSDEMLNSADQIIAFARQVPDDALGEELGESTLRAAYEELASRFDERNAGFSGPPKFPMPHNLLFLLRYWSRAKDENALRMVEKTLQAMRNGGIYDHLGFGFHRYSTDAIWLLPHFEKMLYDQAMLAMVYIEAYQATGREEYARTAKEILSYVLRDMCSTEGGFHSAEDADSEGEEGKFYLWTEEEIGRILGKEDADLIIKVFNMAEEGNFREEATSQRKGNNILHLKKTSTDMASELNISHHELQNRIEHARQRLFAVREKRVHPQKDDKILTDWNGLMIATLAKGAQVFNEPKYGEAAKRAADFILNHMRTSGGRLLHRYRDGQAAIPAYLDDYALLIWGLIELYETNFDAHYLQTALDLNEDLLKHFWDHDGGGFYFTADDAEELLVRQKEIYDGAVPSGNSVAMLNLLRLGHITAHSDFREKADVIGRIFSERVKRSPSAYTQLMIAIDFAVGPSYEVVIVGNSQTKDTKDLLKAVQSRFIPNKAVILRSTEKDTKEPDQLTGFTQYKTAIDGKATAYVCHNYACREPTTDISKMLGLLNVKDS